MFHRRLIDVRHPFAEITLMACPVHDKSLLVWLLVGVALFVPSVYGQRHVTDPQETIRGLTAVAVVIEPVPRGARARGLAADSLLRDVTAVLEAQGLSVLTEAGRLGTWRSPALYVQVSLFADEPTGLYAFHVRLVVEQRVTLRNEEDAAAVFVYATTWDQGATGLVGIDDVVGLRSVVRDLTQQFIEATR